MHLYIRAWGAVKMKQRKAKSTFSSLKPDPHITLVKTNTSYGEKCPVSPNKHAIGCPLVRKFYRTGGTALALSYAHRKSDDLDFFSRNRFNPSALQLKLESPFKFRLRVKEEGTLHCQLNRVNVSFLYYPYPLLRRFLNYHGVAVSDPLDIALTKITAIAQRGSRRDFIDLYWACHEGLTLPFLLKKFREKYGKTNYS